MSSFVINPYRFAGAAFSPVDVSGLEIWLDASDSTTLFDATSGGSLPANGSDVKRWEDKSGNGRHFTRSSGVPSRATSVVNSKDAVQFVGSTESLYRTDGTFSKDDMDNVFFVSQTTDTTYLFLAAEGDNNAYLDATASVGVPNFAGATVSAFRVNGASVSATRSALLTARGSAPNIFAAIGVSASAVQFANFRLNYGSGAYPVSDGYACELLVYSGSLSTADRDDIEQYLADKWGITL